MLQYLDASLEWKSVKPFTNLDNCKGDKYYQNGVVKHIYPHQDILSDFQPAKSSVMVSIQRQSNTMETHNRVRAVGVSINVYLYFVPVHITDLLWGI